MESSDPSSKFYATGIQRLMQTWGKRTDNEGDFVEKQSLKGVPMIYGNLIIIVITVSENKNRRHYFCADPVPL